MKENQNKLSKFWQELKRRKVISVIIVYATIAFILMQLAPLLEDSLNLPLWFDTLITILLIIGFPIAVIFSWVFDVSSKGIQKTESVETETLPDKTPVSLSKQIPPDKSIIVLPFENISSDPEQEYFSDGLTEEIITDLSHIQDLLVISRSSAMTFKGSKKKIKEIAGDVNVRYVLEGSVRKSGNNLRITAQLIDASNDSHIWAEKYSGTMDDIFDIQEKVSKSIVDSLKIRLSSNQKARIVKPKIENVAVYEQYLIARNEIWRCSKESLGHAIQLLNSSIGEIGRNEYLLLALGLAYFQYVNAGIEPEVKHLNKAEELIDEVIVLNSSLPKAHYIKSMIYETKGNLKESFNSIQRAFKLNPEDPEVLMMLSFLYVMVGKPKEAEPIAKHAIERDPLNPIIYFSKWLLDLSEGKLDIALETSGRLYNLDTSNIMSVWNYALTLAINNRITEATRLFDSLIKTYPDEFLSKFGKAILYAINNDKPKALQSITEDLIKAAEMDHMMAWVLAGIYSLIGENDKSVYFLERTTKEIFINYPWFAKHDPFLKNIRSDEQFKKLMKKVKYKWENFKV